MTKSNLGVLRTLNLNLLPVLYELLHCHSVSETARRLNLTQPAVSGSLRQLRIIFSDELLVQQGRSLIPTEKARRLAPEVAQVVRLADHVFAGDTFDPQTSKRHYRVATADYMAALIATSLSKALTRAAPLSSLELVPTPGTSAKDLRLGTLDLIICPARPTNLRACGIEPADHDFHYDVLFTDEFVGIQWNGSKCPSAASQGAYFARSHVMYCRPDGVPTFEQEVLSQLGLSQEATVFLPYFTLIPQLIQGTDLVGLVPRRLAERYQNLFELDLFTPPYKMPPLEITMVSHKNRESHRDLRWLRETLCAIAKSAAL